MEIIVDPKNVDWHVLHSFIGKAFAYMHDRIDPPSSFTRMTAESLLQKAEYETLIVAIENNAMLGCLFMREAGEWFYIGKVAVDEQARGRGIARQMVNRAFELAQAANAKGLELETRIELIENHKTFGKMGFVKVGESAHEGYDRPTSICMRAKI